MPFLQPFTYKEINLDIIYKKTDYSMYKAWRGLGKWGSQELNFGRKKKTTKC